MNGSEVVKVNDAAIRKVLEQPKVRRWKASKCRPLMALLLLVVSALVMLPIVIYFLKDLF